MTVCRFALAALLCALAAATELPHPLSDDFINLINAKQNMWTAGRNFPPYTPFNRVKNLIGVIPNENREKKLPLVRHDANLIASLPESFDSRNKWPNCPTLNEIRDQGSCKSSWAVATTAAMSDRVCIYSNGTEHFHFSAVDLLSCCTNCGNGCEGGIAEFAWNYWVTNGLVSGGNYNSNQGCRPYEIPTCAHHHSGNKTPCSHVPLPTPKCVTSCKSSYNMSYNMDKRFGRNANAIFPCDEDQMKAELYTHGPIVAVLKVYTDFFSYKSGVYNHTQGEEVGGFDVKILGWGVENGIKYWVAANSWNTEWGDKGFFKILRGVNHCEIETFVTLGDPFLTKGN